MVENFCKIDERHQSIDSRKLVNPMENPSLPFSCSVVSDSLRPYGLQHTRLPYPSPSLGVYLSSCPLNQWCHPTISFPVALFSFCLQSFPASGSFPMSQLFASGGQSTPYYTMVRQYSQLPITDTRYLPVINASSFISTCWTHISFKIQLTFQLSI